MPPPPFPFRLNFYGAWTADFQPENPLYYAQLQYLLYMHQEGGCHPPPQLYPHQFNNSQAASHFHNFPEYYAAVPLHDHSYMHQGGDGAWWDIYPPPHPVYPHEIHAEETIDDNHPHPNSDDEGTAAALVVFDSLTEDMVSRFLEIKICERPTAAEGGEDADPCVVCQADLCGEDGKIGVLSCKHRLQQKNTCPLCKAVGIEFEIKKRT